MRTRADGGIHYAWVVAGAAFVALVMAAGFRSVTGVLLVPLHDRFGWSHETIALAASLNLIVYGLSSPFAAALIDRFGLRRVMVTALLTVAASSLASVWMTAPWQLYVLWTLNGAGTAAIAIPLATIVSHRWFVSRRGLLTGLLSASNASGQLVFLPVLAVLAGIDWRWVAVAVACVAALVVTPVVAVFIRNAPADVGLLPYGATADFAPPPPSPNAFRGALAGLAAVRTSGTFWLLAGSFFVCGATTNGLIGTHLIPAAHDHGIAAVTAAGLMALIGGFDIVGTVASGWLTDRYDSRRLLSVYYGLRGLSLIALPFILSGPHAILVGFAVVYGLDWVATVPPTAALTADRFGRHNVGVLFGWIFAAHQLGAAFAAEAAGVVRTVEGSYELAFIGAGVLGVAAAAVVTRIRRAPEPLLAGA